MSTINKMLKAVNSIKLSEQIPYIIESTKNELASYNKSQLFIDGIDSEGKKLRQYSLNTVEYKKLKNQPFDRTTLFDTGSFYRQWKVEYFGELIFFESLDSKTPDLIEKYGNKIFGLTNENKTLYSFGAFYESVKKHITSKTGLQFV